MTHRHPFEQSIATFIDEKGLPKSPAKLIVALSGGADSVALASVLTALGYECVAAHCNFRLRGDESTRDRNHAVSIARQLGIDIRVQDFDIPARMAATGESIEMACRTLRYDWFNDLTKREHAIGIAVGHHREDSAETFIINLMRSSGINGLTGINPISGLVIRPLLNTSRQDIEQYLHDLSLTWVNDSTNAESEFRRNAVRNRVIPLLDEIFGPSTKAILASADHLAEVKAVYDRTIAKIRQKYLINDTLYVGRMISDLNEDHIVTTYVYELLSPKGFSRNTADRLVLAVKNNSTGIRFDSTKGISAYLDHGIVTLSYLQDKNSSAEYEVDISEDIISPINIKVSHENIQSFDNHNTDHRSCYLDSRVLFNHPKIILRHRRIGDRIKPFGMGGRSKLVSDIMTEARYTTRQKEEAWLLTYNDEVLWIVGLRASNNFIINNYTTDYYKLTPQ